MSNDDESVEKMIHEARMLSADPQTRADAELLARVNRAVKRRSGAAPAMRNRAARRRAAQADARARRAAGLPDA